MVPYLGEIILLHQGRIQDLRKGGGPWRARGARAYNGGLGGEAPLKLKAFFGHFYTKEGPNVKHLNEADYFAQPRPAPTFGQWGEGVTGR